MYNILDFPKKYLINKNFHKNEFLKNANLTDAEAKYLEKYTELLQLIYDIKFEDDSEIIVVYTEASYPSGRNMFFLKNYISAITQSFPYKCMIILGYYNSIKLFIPYVHSNSVNCGRQVVERIFETPLLRTDSFDTRHYAFISHLKESIAVAKSADELQLLWMENIKYSFGGDCISENARDEAFALERAELHNELRMEKEFENGFIYGYFFEKENDNDDERNCLDENIDEEIAPYYNYDERICFEFFQTNCWPLYNEANCNFNGFNERITKLTWLYDYSHACATFFRGQLNYDLPNEYLLKFKEAFEQEISSSGIEPYDYAIGDLKKLLPQYFDIIAEEDQNV